MSDRSQARFGIAESFYDLRFTTYEWLHFFPVLLYALLQLRESWIDVESVVVPPAIAFRNIPSRARCCSEGPVLHLGFDIFGHGYRKVGWHGSERLHVDGSSEVELC